MHITDEIIDYVAALSRLDIPAGERERLGKELESILIYMDILSKLDTEGVEPMSHVFPVRNVFREDEVVQLDNREELLSNAPRQKDGCFMVPKTVE